MDAQPRKGALIAGLILVLIGVAFLLENWFGHIAFWRLAWKLWPILLILIGLRRLYGFLTWHEPGLQSPSPIPPLPPVPPAPASKE